MGCEVKYDSRLGYRDALKMRVGVHGLKYMKLLNEFLQVSYLF